jgi:hypothetical protein
MIFVVILVLHLQKEHKERNWLFYHLRTKMKYLVLKNNGPIMTKEKILQMENIIVHL